ncbi:DUF58 domain-containing protein [Pseudarthrobacter sp. P1]|uniref:DUF58 domain-containing protein n=1 Tax=Pseudarthrobacter sp. P1 TaxID=3418418 RepID=UPI003CEA4041
MASWLPHRFFRPRGWAMLAAGLLALLCAQVMGRRDLLTLGIFLLLLPLLAAAGLRLLRPGFRIARTFAPDLVEAGTTTTVGLSVQGSRHGGGRIEMREKLPARFGPAPTFLYPSRGSGDGPSRYAYHLVSAQRGQFRIGPASAEFSDPFNLTILRQDVDAGSLLTVAPAAVALGTSSLTGGLGLDGMTATRQRANPSDDDVMTREYRYGDPLRRVHWPATARHGQLMVRQEESVTTPEATLVLDQRTGSFAGGLSGVFGLAGHDAVHPELATSEAFEWAVVAAMSICTHLIERNYSVRVLDAYAQPGFLHSRSAPSRHEEVFEGSAGLAAIAASLAALELVHPPVAGSGRQLPVAGEPLAQKLSHTRRRGPVVALLGQLGPAEATALAPVAEHGEGAVAILVCEHPARAGESVAVLRRAGWHALAVSPQAELAEVWAMAQEASSGVGGHAAGRADGRAGGRADGLRPWVLP